MGQFLHLDCIVHNINFTRTMGPQMEHMLQTMYAVPRSSFVGIALSGIYMSPQQVAR